MHAIRLAFRNVLRQQRRSAIALVAITAGVVALLFAGGFIDWILRDFREQTIRTQFGHIQVHPAADASSNRSPGPSHPTLGPEFSAQLGRIARAPHVVAVAPRLSIGGLISHADTTLAFVGTGIDAGRDVVTRSPDNLVAGAPLDVNDRTGIVVGEGLAANLGVKPGSKTVVLVNLPGGGVNASDVTIRGIFKTVNQAYDDVALRMPLALAQSLLHTKGADLWVITLDRTAMTEPVLAALRADPALRDLRFVPWTDLADFYNKAVLLYRRQFRLLQFIIAAIIVLSITNTMAMSVNERTGEIGTMMAIGTTRGDVLRQFLIEGLLLGLIGGALGIGIGYLVNAVISSIGLPMPPAPGMRHGFVAGATFDPIVAIESMALAMVTAVLASVYPAARAARMRIVDALRAAR